MHMPAGPGNAGVLLGAASEPAASARVCAHPGGTGRSWEALRTWAQCGRRCQGGAQPLGKESGWKMGSDRASGSASLRTALLPSSLGTLRKESRR